MRNIDAPKEFHFGFPFFLLLKQLFLSRNIAAIKLFGNVFAKRSDRRTRDDGPTDNALDRDLELMAGNFLGQSFTVMKGSGGEPFRDERGRKEYQPVLC